MLKIAICDDEKIYAEKVKRLVEHNLRKAKSTDFKISIFMSGYSLLKEIETVSGYQVIFLDINMQESNGIEIAHSIKEKNTDIILIFVTAYIDYALAGYKVEAFRFLLKDDLDAMMMECIRALLKKLNKIDMKYSFKFLEGEQVISLKKILYIESFRHDMVFHVNEKVEVLYHMRGNLRELEEKLGNYGFCRIHKSFLVNMQMVQSIKCYFVELVNGECITIPRAKYQAVRREYFKIIGEI